jgi:hypothetical protein
VSDRQELLVRGVPEHALGPVLAYLERKSVDRARSLLAAALETALELSLAACPERSDVPIPLSPEMAAKRAAVSRRTIARAIARGQLLTSKGATGLISIDRASFEKWRFQRRPPALSHGDRTCQVATVMG